MTTTAVRLILLSDHVPTAFCDAYQNQDDQQACVNCGKRTSRAGNSLGVWIGHDGGTCIIHPDDVDAEYELHPGSFLGWFPVGSECIKRVPAEYRAPDPYDDTVKGV